MVTLFTYLSDIITYKRGDVPKSFEDYNLLVPFLNNRWLSMYSSQFCKIVNNTVNKYWNIFTKEEYYKFLVTIIPKSHFKKIDYIKKIKPDKEKDFDPVITLLAQNLNLSKREITSYVEQLEIDLTPYLKALGAK